MLTSVMVLVLSQLPSAQDFLDNAEIGDAQQYLQLRSRGAYEAHVVDKAKGDTVVSGHWKIAGDTLEVKAAACRGATCKDVKKDYSAKVSVVAARAMLISSTAPKPFFQSGAYYCHYLGCEPRVGVEVRSHGADLKAMHAVEDHLIARNRGRDVTVVWIGPRPDADTSSSFIELCGREPDRAKKALETLQADLAEVPWFGPVRVVDAPVTDCLWDVRLSVRDDLAPPVKRKR